ncbi:MAG: TIGR02281 family clan AA aspartic protease [Hyphomicrobiales bacterium]|nr:TIGR02281 family clan AA aspartic protease [Hyphomicrobiales bacterium]
MYRLVMIAALAVGSAIGAVPLMERLSAGEEVPLVSSLFGRSADKRPSAPVQQKSSYGRRVSVRADDKGHFQIDAKINGRHVALMFDTGASAIALTDMDGRRLGLNLREKDYTIAVSTANGQAAAAPVRLDEVRVGDIRVRDVPAFVMKPGLLEKSLLGMTFLKRIDSFEVAGDRLIMTD